MTLEAVQAAIPANAALIELAAYRPFDPAVESVGAAFGKLRYAAYVVHRTGPPSAINLGEAAPIDKAVEALRAALGDPARSDVRRLSRALEDAVMRPLRGLVRDSTHLLISPDGALNLIPFEALLDERGRYLVQRFRCTYLTSGRDLLRMQVERDSQRGPLIVANPAFGEPVASPPRGLRRPSGGTGEQRRSVTSARDLSEVYFAPIAGTTREAQAIRRLAHRVEGALVPSAGRDPPGARRSHRGGAGVPPLGRDLRARRRRPRHPHHLHPIPRRPRRRAARRADATPTPSRCISARSATPSGTSGPGTPRRSGS